MPAEHLTIELLMLDNNVVDYLLNAITTVSARLYDNKQFKLKFLKEDFFQKRRQKSEEK